MFGRRIREKRVIQDPKWGDWGTGGSNFVFGPNTAAGQSVTPNSALYLPTVYGCHSLIESTISTLPVDFYRTNPDGTTVEVAPPRWAVQPNTETDWITFVSQLVDGLLRDGNDYVIPVYGKRGDLVEVWPTEPTRWDVHRNGIAGPRMYNFDGVPYRGDLFHVVGKMAQAGQVKGHSPIEHAKQTLGMESAGLEFGASFFKNNAAPSGVIEIPGKLDDDVARQLKADWSKHHSGRNAHTPGVLTGGATWKQVQITHEQAQFLETRRFTAGQIAANIYGIDPSWVGVGVEGQSLTYQNMEDRWIQLARFALMPWVARLEQLFYQMLPRPQYAKFNFDALLRADTKTRFEAYELALGGVGSHGVAFMTVDEIREKEDLPPMAMPEPPEPPGENPPDEPPPVEE